MSESLRGAVSRTENDWTVNCVGTAGVRGVDRTRHSSAGVRQSKLDAGARTREIISGRRGRREVQLLNGQGRAQVRVCYFRCAENSGIAGSGNASSPAARGVESVPVLFQVLFAA